MEEFAEQDVQDIRKLLRTPTPENVEAVNRKLESVVSFLASVKTSMDAGQSCDSNLQKFLTRLPSEMSAINVLMKEPSAFFRGLNAQRASKFGSYEHTGALKSFEIETSSKTLIHM
ncbi:MAG: hypothetical protein M3Y72_06970 [Acidobacteriota bacterium]|nr:hypothetical protein [Acidobacteriota bacterium]